MIYYKDVSDQVYAYNSLEDKNTVGLVGLTAITEAVALALVNPVLTVVEERSIMPALSPFQLRKVLVAKGLRVEVDALVASSDQETQDGYEYATQFERDHPLILGMAAALGYSDTLLDEIFNEGILL